MKKTNWIDKIIFEYLKENGDMIPTTEKEAAALAKEMDNQGIGLQIEIPSPDAVFVKDCAAIRNILPPSLKKRLKKI